MKARFRLAVGLSATTMFWGCALFHSTPHPLILPPYIHKLAIRPFTNHTQQYGLEDKLTPAVQSEFNRDGRYQITSEDQADGVVIGDISKYILEPLTYDVNHVPTQYKLWIQVTLSFYDKVQKQTLWTEPNMTGELRYYVASSGLPGALTEDDARVTIWDQLSRDIRTRTLEGFGAGDAKSLPNTSPDQYNFNAAPTSTNPPPVPPEEPKKPSPPQLPY